MQELLRTGIYFCKLEVNLPIHLDATDVFVSLIAQKHTRKTDKEYLAKTQEMRYNKDEVHSDRVPSGLCG